MTATTNDEIDDPNNDPVDAGTDGRIVAQALAGGVTARRDLLERVLASGRDHAALAPLLDPLARAASAGDVRALDLLVTAVDRSRLAEPVIRRLVVADDRVDEVLQDVLVALASSITGFRGDARFTTWLHRVAHNQAVSHVRRHARRQAGEPVPETASQRISSQIATRRHLVEVLEGLPDHYREPVVLRDVEACTYQEVADRLGLNLNTARSRIARGRALVAGALRSD